MHVAWGVFCKTVFSEKKEKHFMEKKHVGLDLLSPWALPRTMGGARRGAMGWRGPAEEWLGLGPDGGGGRPTEARLGREA